MHHEFRMIRPMVLRIFTLLLLPWACPFLLWAQDIEELKRGVVKITAQVNEVKQGTNRQNIDKLVPDVMDAVKSGNFKLANDRLSEIEGNIPYVRDKFDHIGDRLHETDKTWLKQTSKEETLRSFSNFGVETGVLRGKVRALEDTSSALNSFKSA